MQLIQNRSQVETTRSGLLVVEPQRVCPKMPGQEESEEGASQGGKEKDQSLRQIVFGND